MLRLISMPTTAAVSIEAVTRNFSTSSAHMMRTRSPIETRSTHRLVETVKQFTLYNKRGTKQFKRDQNRKHPKYPDIPIKKYVQQIGLNHYSKGEFIPEMVPDLIVPDP